MDQHGTIDTSSATELRTADSKPREDEYREKAAGALEQGARKARELGSDAPGGVRTTRWGYQAGNTLDEASEYVREHNLEDMKRDVTNWTRQNPTPALLTALAIGFIAGRAMRSNY